MPSLLVAPARRTVTSPDAVLTWPIGSSARAASGPIANKGSRKRPNRVNLRPRMRDVSPIFPRGGPMPADLVLDLSATTSGLHECLDRIEQSSAGWNLPRAMVARLRIVVEELYSNTIKHGYG